MTTYKIGTFELKNRERKSALRRTKILRLNTRLFGSSLMTALSCRCLCAIALCEGVFRNKVVEFDFSLHHIKTVLATFNSDRQENTCYTVVKSN